MALGARLIAYGGRPIGCVARLRRTRLGGERWLREDGDVVLGLDRALDVDFGQDLGHLLVGGDGELDLHVTGEEMGLHFAGEGGVGVLDVAALVAELAEFPAGKLEAIKQGSGLARVNGIVGEGTHDADGGELVGVLVLDDGESAAAGVEVGGLVKDAVVASAARRSHAGLSGVVNVLAARRIVHIESGHKWGTPLLGC
jgi:hypothetical protein